MFQRLVDRRDVLKVGSIALASQLATHRGAAAAAPESAGAGKAKSVILLWLGGGVTHIDSFDPKPDAPESIRGTLGTVATCTPGLRFGEPMVQLAKLADKFALIRTFSHDSNDHLLSQVYTLSGRKVGRNQLFSEPNVGSVISFLQGSRNDLPGYIAVPGITRPGPPPHNLFVAGWLGGQYAPFAVGGTPQQPDFTKGPNLANPSARFAENLAPATLELVPNVSVDRLAQRRGLRDLLGQSLRALESSSKPVALEGNYRHAFELLTSPRVRGAFDLESETDATRESYGRTKIGGRCLLARRLVEAGARFVMVDYGYDPDYGNLWDNHNAVSQNFPHISEMCKRGYHLAGIDRAFAGLLTDLGQRGLLDSTLVVFLTEFGRTPKINSRGGRDHWGACGSIFFAGAGVGAGRVVGTSDKHAAYPITRGYTPADVAATIYHSLGFDPEMRIRDKENRPVPLLDHGQPIAAALS